MLSRRLFMKEVALGTAGAGIGLAGFGRSVLAAPVITGVNEGESLPAYLLRNFGEVESTLYAQVLGAASEFKEGDEIIGVAAIDAQSRSNARSLLANTTLAEIDRYAPHKQLTGHPQLNNLIG